MTVLNDSKYKFWVVQNAPDGFSRFMLVYMMGEEEFRKLKRDLTTVGNIAEMVACCQDFETQYDAMCMAFGAPSAVALADPASRSYVRQQAEMLLIRMRMFTHSLNTLLRRMNRTVADEFRKMQRHAWEHQRALILAKMMRNYLEHFYRLPTKFSQDYRDGKDEWTLILKSEEIMRAAEEDDFKLRDTPRSILLESADIDIGEVCVVGSSELLALSHGIPFKSYLSDCVLPALQRVESFLRAVAPDGVDLFVSRPMEPEPKRHIPIDLGMLEVIGRLCDSYPCE